MPLDKYDVHWADLHGDDLSEFRTLKALDHADAAQDMVEDEERGECSYPVGEGRDTVAVLVREHGTDEAWKSFTVRGEVRLLYCAEETP